MQVDSFPSDGVLNHHPVVESSRLSTEPMLNLGNLVDITIKKFQSSVFIYGIVMILLFVF